LNLLLLLDLLAAITADGEVDEEVQIRTVHDTTGNKVIFAVVAPLTGVHVVPRGDAHSSTDKHLRDLAEGDEESGEPFGADSERRETVVAIHKGMHGVVHGHEVQPTGCHGRVCIPAVQQHCHVVVPVEEDEGFLAEHDEHRVNQLRHFGENEEHHPEPRGTSPPVVSRGLTYCILKALL